MSVGVEAVATVIVVVDVKAFGDEEGTVIRVAAAFGGVGVGVLIIEGVVASI